MAESRHHEDHHDDGIYVPPPRDVPRETLADEQPIPAEQLPARPSFPPARPTPPHDPRSSRRAWWIAAGAVVLTVAIAAGTLVGLNLAARSGTDTVGATCGGQPVLRVAVTPEFAPVVEPVARELPGAPSGCSLVSVIAQEPAETVNDLSSKAKAPDAWIPSSSAWLRLATATATAAKGSTATSNKGSTSGGGSSTPASGNPSTTAAALFAENPVSLARSPVVVAAPRPFAESLGWPGKQLGWADLTGRVAARQIARFSMANPLRDSASLLAVLGVQIAMARTTIDPGVAQMRALTLRARLAEAEADPATLLKKLGEQSDAAKALQEVGLFPVTEQALWEYTRTSHLVPLVGIYPPDGLLEADYPLALTTKTARDAGRREVASRLTERIRAREFIGELTQRGLRPAAQVAASAGAGVTVVPAGSGLLLRYQQPAALPAQIADVVTTWAQYKRLTYQTLLLVDGSGSMNDQVRDRSGKVTTKAELLRLAGIQAAQLFGEDTSLGMWLFATPNATSPPYTVALPFGPINDAINGVPRRDVMRAVAQTYKAYPQAGTPLFETVLQGVADMRGRFQPDAVSMVVVLTDGHDKDTRFAMSPQQFLARLNAERDPARPVPVFGIGYGADADLGVLNDMARITGGRAVASNDPGDLASAVAKIFLAAHQPR